MSRRQKVLIITSSGGGGLLQAANAKEQEILAQDPNATVLQRDVMKDWAWAKLGQYSVNRWNRAQLRGDVKEQSSLGASVPIADYLFWLPIFFCALYTLFREEIDRVIDTQVLGTSATLKAIRLYNRWKKKQLYLEKVLVDLPTKKAIHFFKPISLLNPQDRKTLRLVTIAPLLDPGQTAEEFWKHHCKLAPEQLQYEDYYVRKAFVAYRGKQRTHKSFAVKVRFQNPEELEYILQSVHRGSGDCEVSDGAVRFKIPPSALLFTFLLGSQPAGGATFQYAMQCMKSVGDRPVYAFIFCAKHDVGKDSLLRRVSEAVHQCDAYPKNLTIVPMSFQSDDVIAPLFFRSDMTCTRSGGQTAMELMSVSSGAIWIHSEAKIGSTPLTEEELLAGIPGWESANAVYLQQMRGAKIVTTETIGPLIKELAASK